MKETFVITQDELTAMDIFPYIARDRGQIDKYEVRPAVKFPCALISISQPKRKNLSSVTQDRQITITIRVAFQRLQDDSNISTQNERNKALEYYNIVQSIDERFQGFRNAYFAAPWECTACVDEQRPDMDIVRFTFSTKLVK